MFGRDDDYNGKENYKRDREDRLEYLENLSRKAQDEFNDSFFKRSENFDTLHKSSNNYIPNDEHFTYHSEDEDKKSKSGIRKVIVSTLAIGALGILGYLGFNNSNTIKQNSKANLVENVKENNNSDVKPIDKEEISQKIINSQRIEPVEREPVATRTPEPIITPNAENKIVTAIAKVTPKPIQKDIEQEDVKQDDSKKDDIKNIEPTQTPKPKDEVTTQDSNKVVEHKEEKKKSKIVTDETRRAKKVKKPQYRVVTVKKGDTLASLAERYYGNPMDFKRIVRANRDIRSSHSRLHLGQKVIIPIITHSKNARLVRVRRGDTLYSIARRYYGSSKKYQKIIDANYKIKSIHTPLHVGEVIRVPR